MHKTEKLKYKRVWRAWLSILKDGVETKFFMPSMYLILESVGLTYCCKMISAEQSSNYVEHL